MKAGLLDNRSVQRALNTAGHYRGHIDGVFGSQSQAAARVWAAATVRSYKETWPDQRVRVAVEQWMMQGIGAYTGPIDGIEGPLTQLALAKWQDHLTFNRRSPNPGAGVPKATQWPRQRDLVKFYGKPGTGHTRIKPPYPIFYGDDELEDGYIIHEKCAESRMRIYERTLSEYGPERIHELGIDRFGGCFNNRKMRNGRTLSTHAYACAEDWDPTRNQLRETSRTARFARPEYAPFIDAFEAEGWISLGRARDFDWMHFQAARF